MKYPRGKSYRCFCCTHEFGHHESTKSVIERVANGSNFHRWLVPHFMKSHGKSCTGQVVALCASCYRDLHRVKDGTKSTCFHCDVSTVSAPGAGVLRRGGVAETADSKEFADSPHQHVCQICHVDCYDRCAISLPEGVAVLQRGHKNCVFCGCFTTRSSHSKVLSHKARLKLLLSHGLFCTQGARCCAMHLDAAGLPLEPVHQFAPAPDDSRITIKEAELVLDELITEISSSTSEKVVIFDPDAKLGSQGYLSEAEYSMWTGWTSEQFAAMAPYLKGKIHSSTNRSLPQALFIFWLKLKTDLSFEQIASLMGLPNIVDKSTARCVMASTFLAVLDALTEKFVPRYLGIEHLTRAQALAHHTAFSKAFCGEDWVVLIMNGTYFYAVKSGHYKLMRAQYSMHQKRSLSKLMSVVLPDGYVLDSFGPFFTDVRNTDSDVLKLLVTWQEKLMNFLTPYREDQTEEDGEGDCLVLDRGFFNAVPSLKERRLRSLMPAFLNRKGETEVCEPLPAVEESVFVSAGDTAKPSERRASQNKVISLALDVKFMLFLVRRNARLHPLKHRFRLIYLCLSFCLCVLCVRRVQRG